MGCGGVVLDILLGEGNRRKDVGVAKVVLGGEGAVMGVGLVLVQVKMAELEHT